MDFGTIYLYVLENFILPFFGITVTFFGLPVTIGAVFAWVLIGGVLLRFLYALGDS